MIENNLLSLIIFAPLLGAFTNWVLGGWLKIRNEFLTSVIACGTILLSFAVAVYIALIDHGGAINIKDNKPIMDHLWTWIQVGSFRVDFGLAVDHLSGIYVLFITFVGFLIHLFATKYMTGDPGFYRFFAYLNLFMFSMLTLILADNFLLMFVGWEGVGLCSYLLIGFYLKKDEARRAAKKAFVMNRIGDWGVLMGMFLIFTMTGSLSFYEKTVDGVHIDSALLKIAQMSADPFTWGAIVAGGATSVAVLLFIGATGKSAQIPLFTWLPDAMAGPTPVSALIHAATMVTAGVYMVVRCNGIYQNAPSAMFIVAIIGCATAIFAATIGLAQNDIKKVLAYSTVSQLGYMFMACGVGAFTAAIFHVMTHAFFKAQLFLGSGSVINGMHHEQDMRKMGGLKKYMFITYITMTMGWLAICGIPIWAGFFSKDEILYRTFASPNIPQPWNYVLWIVGLLTAVLTAVYMTRMMWMTFYGESRFDYVIPEEEHAHAAAHVDEHAISEVSQSHGNHDAHHAHDDHGDGAIDDHDDDDDDHHHALPPNFHPHESPWQMTVPLVVLGFLSVVGGLVGIPYAVSSVFGGGDVNVFERVLEPVVAKVAPAHAEHAKPQAEHSETAAAEPKGEHATEGEHAEHNPTEIATERGLAVLSVVLAAAGIGIGIFAFGSTPLRKLPQILVDKWRIDDIYNGLIVDPITRFSTKGLWQGVDIGFIDGIVNAAGAAAAAFGSVVRQLQVGFVRSYAAFILVGALAVVGYFIWYAVRLIA